jgi:hypothetical protein
MALKFVFPLVIYLYFAVPVQFPHPMDNTGVHIERRAKVSLPPEDKQYVAKLVLGNDPSTCLSSGNTLRDEIGNIRIVKTELANGEQNLLIQASDVCNCGGTGNCSFWIVRKDSSGFSTLLATRMVQMFSVETTSSNGHKVIYRSINSMERNIVIPVVPKETYSEKEDGTISDEPKVTSKPCRGR